jgi:hypothetical protein
MMLNSAIRAGAAINYATMQIRTEKLRQQAKARDSFCIVNDSFRLFARRWFTLLGSAWVAAELRVALKALRAPRDDLGGGHSQRREGTRVLWKNGICPIS